MRYILLSVLLFLISNASAFQVDMQVTDINTRNTLETVLLSVENFGGNVLNTSSSNADGLISVWINETHLEYNYTYSKLGYHSETNIVSNSTLIIYETLYPISDDGIVKINFGDRLFNPDRQFCIYFDNGRLEGCYKLNDTVKLLVNQEYVLIPKTTFTDSITSFTNIKNNFGNMAFMVIIFIILSILTISIVSHYWRGGLRMPRIKLPRMKNKKGGW